MIMGSLAVRTSFAFFFFFSVHLEIFIFTDIETYS